MTKPSPGRDDRAAQAGSEDQAPVIHADDLEFEIELDMDSDDDVVVAARPPRPPRAPGDAAKAAPAPEGAPGPSRAEPGRVVSPPVAPLPPPPVTAARASATPRASKPPGPRRADEESGGRYAIATRGGESTVVAPRRPVVVPRNR